MLISFFAFFYSTTNTLKTKFSPLSAKHSPTILDRKIQTCPLRPIWRSMTIISHNYRWSTGSKSTKKLTVSVEEWQISTILLQFWMKKAILFQKFRKCLSKRLFMRKSLRKSSVPCRSLRKFNSFNNFMRNL
jgi:hypothetical protein